MLPPIDIGEAYAVVLGLKPILAKRTQDVTDAQAAQVAKLPDTIAKRARSLVRGALLGPVVPIVDYDLVLRETAETLDIVHIESVMRGLPIAAKLPYATVASHEYTALQTALPKTPYKTTFGVENLPPDLTRLLAFSDLYAALEDPIGYLFASMADASLSPTVIPAVKAVYPTLTQAVTQAIRDAVADRKQPVTLAPAVELGLSTWMGVPQDLPPPMPEEKPAEVSKPKSAKTDLDKSALTPTERIDAK